MSANLPDHPRWEQIRKQAKDLLKSARAGDPEAVDRIAAHFPTIPPAQATLAQAQLTLARHYGYSSWTAMKRDVPSPPEGPYKPFRRDFDYYEDRADGLLSVLQSGLPAALADARTFHPDADGSPFTLDDARIVIARQHGHNGWEEFRSHIADLASGAAHEPFLEAFEAMEARDAPLLRRILARHPEIVNARGTNANTLLNLAASMETTSDLSQPPAAATDGKHARQAITEILIGAGARADDANDRGWTALHQAAYSNNLALTERLLLAGASVKRAAHGDGGTPLMMALFWGHREAADRLAKEGIAPRNLRTAAGLGRLDLLREMFENDGSLTADAGAHRAFYRPHSGFPAWRPSGNAVEILDESLVYAAKNGRVEAMAFLLDRGARPDAEPYNGTPLHWAAANGHEEAVRLLLNAGADVDRTAGFGGVVGITALHAAAWNGRLETVKALVGSGADITRRDPSFHGFPAGWAEHSGHMDVRGYLLDVGAPRDIFHAVAANRPDLVGALLDADPGLVNRDDRWTLPLVDAAARGHTDIVRILLRRGADPSRGDSGGRTARAAAEENGHTEIVALLP
jgi:ankyrin repeat protein